MAPPKLLQKQAYSQVQKEEYNFFADRNIYEFSMTFQELVEATEEITNSASEAREDKQTSINVPENFSDAEQLSLLRFPQPELINLINITQAGQWLSKKSMAFVSRCLNYRRIDFLFANISVYRVLALRVFAEHTKNGGMLDKEIIAKIFSILNQLYDNEIVFFVVVLSHVIINNSELTPEQRNIFYEKVDLLMQ